MESQRKGKIRKEKKKRKKEEGREKRETKGKKEKEKAKIKKTNTAGLFTHIVKTPVQNGITKKR
jgi:hypothetical protein